MTGVPRLVSLSDVWAALDTCLPGYIAAPTDHYWRIRTSGSSAFCNLPLGPHGRRARVDIEAGHVRHLSRFFQIEDCMRTALPSLGL